MWLAYKLALHLKRASGRRLLRELTAKEWREWQVYLRSEPLLEHRFGPWFASIRQTLAEQWRDRSKKPFPYKIEDFMLRFGDDKPTGPTRGKQTWQQQKEMLFQYSRELAKANAMAQQRRGGVSA